MSPDYLHNHAQFADLVRIVGQEKSIDPALVEKDYWIMHSRRFRIRFAHAGFLLRRAVVVGACERIGSEARSGKEGVTETVFRPLQ
jgi:hypothetical protein